MPKQNAPFLRGGGFFNLKAMTKTYQSNEYMKLVLTIEINGGIPVECVFKGGKHFPYRENGTYRTDSKAIQEALEKHERYPGDFSLIKTTEDAKAPEPVKVVEPKAEAPATKPTEPVSETTPEPANEVAPEPPKPAVDGTIIVSEVNNSQEAKLYLNRNFDVPFSRLKNTEMVMKETKLANLSFPNWKI